MSDEATKAPEQSPMDVAATARLCATLQMLGLRIGADRALLCGLNAFILTAERVTSRAAAVAMLRAAAARLESAADDAGVAH